MSHWAELDENNVVIRVLVGDNNEADEGYQWLMDNLGGTWVQTSYNGTIRKNYAGVGYSYHSDIDAFVPSKCHEEAVLDTSTALWICNNEAHTIKEIME